MMIDKWKNKTETNRGYYPETQITEVKEKLIEIQERWQGQVTNLNKQLEDLERKLERKGKQERCNNNNKKTRTKRRYRNNREIPK